MTMASRRAGALLLAGLVAAGCGKEPVPAPARPAPPTRSKPTGDNPAGTVGPLRVTRVGFTVSHPGGWSANTFFGEDLCVSGGHLSGGEGEVFLHETSDKASPELWARLSELALAAGALPAKPLQPRPEKVCAIAIDLSDGRNLVFEADLEVGYREPTLQALSELLRANERVYGNQQGKGWRLKAIKDPASRPTVIAWGETLNGLQVGLQAVGGEEELRIRRTADLAGGLARYTGPAAIEIKPAAAPALTEGEIISRARAIGRQRWPEQVKDWPADQPATVFDDEPEVTRDGDNWKVVFQLGNPERAGSRATVTLDAAVREISTKCEWAAL